MNRALIICAAAAAALSFAACNKNQATGNQQPTSADTCNATNTSGCNHIPKIEVGSNPSDLTLDPHNHTAYVPNFFDNDASMFALFGKTRR